MGKMSASSARCWLSGRLELLGLLGFVRSMCSAMKLPESEKPNSVLVCPIMAAGL